MENTSLASTGHKMGHKKSSSCEDGTHSGGSCDLLCMFCTVRCAQAVEDFSAPLEAVDRLASRPLEGVRLGLVTETLGAGVDAAVADAVRAAVAHLQALGATVNEVLAAALTLLCHFTAVVAICSAALGCTPSCVHFQRKEERVYKPPSPQQVPLLCLGISGFAPVLLPGPPCVLHPGGFRGILQSLTIRWPQVHAPTPPPLPPPSPRLLPAPSPASDLFVCLLTPACFSCALYSLHPSPAVFCSCLCHRALPLLWEPCDALKTCAC